MSELPARLSPGQHLSAHWLNRLLDFLRSLVLRPGPGIQINRTPSGTTISLARKPRRTAVADGFCLGIVSSRGSGSLLVRLYPSGPTGEEGDLVQLHTPSVFRRSPFKPGDAILCHLFDIRVTGEGEES